MTKGIPWDIDNKYVKSMQLMAALDSMKYRYDAALPYNAKEIMMFKKKLKI